MTAIFYNEDLMLFDIKKLENSFDCVYSDPPWGEANLKYWRTINNQKGYSVNWIQFLHKLGLLIKEKTKENAHIFIETGLRFEQDVKIVLKNYGLNLQQKFNCFYGSGFQNPNLLLYFAKEEKEKLQDVYLNGGEKMVHSILKQILKKDDWVLDPCCGLGTTAKIATKLNANFVGIELNKERIERAKEEYKKCILKNF